MFVMGPDSASETLVTECSFVPKKCCHVHISSPESSLCFLFGFPDALFILLLFGTSTLHRNVCLLAIHLCKRKQILSIWYTGNSFYDTLHTGLEGTQNQPGNKKKKSSLYVLPQHHMKEREHIHQRHTVHITRRT